MAISSGGLQIPKVRQSFGWVAYARHSFTPSCPPFGKPSELIQAAHARHPLQSSRPFRRLPIRKAFNSFGDVARWGIIYRADLRTNRILGLNWDGSPWGVPKWLLHHADVELVLKPSGSILWMHLGYLYMDLTK